MEDHDEHKLSEMQAEEQPLEEELPSAEKVFSAYKEEHTPLDELRRELPSIEDVVSDIYGQRVSMANAFDIVSKAMLDPAHVHVDELDDAIKELTPAFGFQRKMLYLATMSIMEWCQTYGCPREVERKVYEWTDYLNRWLEEERKAQKRMDELAKQQYLSMEELFSKVKEEIPTGVKLAPSLYKTSFLYHLRRAIEALKADETHRYMAEVSEFPPVIQKLVHTTALKELPKEKKEKLIQAIEGAHQHYSLTVDDRHEAFIYSIEVLGKAYAVVDVDRGLSIKLYSKENDKEPKLLLTSQASEDMKKLVIETAVDTKVFAGGIILREGTNTLKGPIDIHILTKHGKITYKVKEPMIVHIELKRLIPRLNSKEA